MLQGERKEEKDKFTAKEMQKSKWTLSQNMPQVRPQNWRGTEVGQQMGLDDSKGEADVGVWVGWKEELATEEKVGTYGN